VDDNPGDRQNPCLGLMKPVGIELIGENYIIIHECQVCGIRKRNKTAAEDNFDELLKLASSRKI